MVRLKEKNGEISDALQNVCGDNAPEKAEYKWVTHFKRGQDNAADEAWDRKSSTWIFKAKINLVCALNEENRQLTAETMANT